MSSPKPLSPDEELLWRAVIRITAALPRALDADLLRATGLALHEYAVLLRLSEADGHELRMAELATAAALSPSRITRLVDELRTRGLVTKTRCTADARGYVAALTDQGAARLSAAHPTLLTGAHQHVFDHLTPTAVAPLGHALALVAEQLSAPPSE
jgi:DNA-binding MarR family transcriptional regulator